jgi:hypothetical protein
VITETCQKVKLFAMSLAASFLLFGSVTAQADAQRTANILHQRITGYAPSPSVLAEMAALVERGDAAGAALIAMEDPKFYDDTLKNWITPWTNEARTRVAPLNDYTATVIGLIRDERDFREVLTADVIYVGNKTLVSLLDPMLNLPPASDSSNNHYKQLSASPAITLKEVLMPMKQSEIFRRIPARATAGVMTTRAAAQAFFNLGTNRAMYRHTQLNFLCEDMETVQDATLPGSRIRQDVARDPGDSSISYVNQCAACHSGLDALSGAFAKYDFVEIAAGLAEGADYFESPTVRDKYIQNSIVFPEGYQTSDDSWINPWRTGRNARLGWDPNLPGKGFGAKSLGEELANSRAFSECQVKKAFSLLCLTEPTTGSDKLAVQTIADNFENNQYNLKIAMSEVAAYCTQE